MKLLRRFRFHVSSNCHEGVCEPVLAFSSTCPIHAFDVCDWLKFSCLVLTFCEFMPVWHKAAKGIVLMTYIRCKVHAIPKWRYHHNSRHSQCQTRWLDYTNACRGTYKVMLLHLRHPTFTGHPGFREALTRRTALDAQHCITQHISVKRKLVKPNYESLQHNHHMAEFGATLSALFQMG